MNSANDIYLELDVLENMISVACRLGLSDTFSCSQAL